MVLRHCQEEYMMKAPVNNIIPFSNVDGPGNRITIFFQSCPFSCLYCHNPETINYCIDCGICIDPCPSDSLSFVDGKVTWDQSTCIGCDTCIKVCPNMSTPKINWMSVDELVDFIAKRKAFVDGITVSGGECMMHAEFLEALFARVKELGLTCLIDSNGSHDFSKHLLLLDLSDGVMLDVKASDPVFHEEICKYPNEQVLKNLEYLNKVGKLEEVRTVLLPEQELQNQTTARYVIDHIEANVRYKLLRYRHFGVRPEGIKYFGKTIVSEDEAKRVQDICLQAGHQNVVII